MKRRYKRRTRSPVQSRTSAQESKRDLLTFSHLQTIHGSWFWYDVDMVNPKKPRTPCLNCGKEPHRSYYRYCSNTCQLEYQRSVYIRKWQAGEIVGLQSIGVVSTSIKIYLRKKFGNKCYLCGWSEVNQRTGEVPLVADHIDGNWRNNVEEIRRLLCPNCDALSPTFAGLNRGNGRKNRAVSKRTMEARSLGKATKTSKM